MAEYCNNCGAELFAGQQFCRKCGASVRPAAGKHLLGRLGTGADPLLIKVVNGDIKLKK